MSEGFEWVSHGSSEEEEEKKKSLPVSIKTQPSQLSIKSLAKLALRSLTFAGIVVLALIAKVLLLIIRVRPPKVTISPKIKQVGKLFYASGRSVYYYTLSRLSVISVKKPDWLVLPKVRYRPNIPPIPFEKIRPVLSGLSFILILAGLGAIFSLFDEGFTFSNQILILTGILGLVWYGWDGHARTVIARFLLKIIQMRHKGR